MPTKSIRDEIKQRRPFRSRSQEASVALLRTAHVIRRRLESATGGEGLTLQQYNVLRILRGSRTPLPTMEIADRMIEPACGITRLVTALEGKGLLRREQWPGDRRHYLCQVTPAGLRLLERLDAPINAIDDRFASGLSDSQLDAFLNLLALVRGSGAEATEE